jgi:hypothetical protein
MTEREEMLGNLQFHFIQGAMKAVAYLKGTRQGALDQFLRSHQLLTSYARWIRSRTKIVSKVTIHL